MYTGALMAVGSAVYSVAAGIPGFETGFRAGYNGPPEMLEPTMEAARSGAVTGLLIGGLIQASLWLWMAVMTGKGRAWARVLSTVFFGIGTAGTVAALAGNAAIPGGAAATGPVAFALSLAIWLIGLAAVIFLWRPQSTAYFTAQR